ncbi:NUDIX hydrolase [Mobilicoccus massiliensis]|uniref:NUDIX hydrolase n=1 Tax=Mobilicoccus massiliensis TaxID=1522310 RepID=UPI000A64C4E6|nr:NUDIX hydrolase [Mobilicoccus massiliensis]
MSAPESPRIPVRVRHFDVPVDLVTLAGDGDGDGGEKERGHEVVSARPAATVMVVRDAAGARGAASTGHASQAEAGTETGASGEVEVFMLRRRSSMAFAPNRMVFPGGGVDARDADDHLPWAGPSPRQWAAWLGTSDEAEARELVVAAAREVFEECGVLLAGPDAETLVGDVSSEQWHAERDRLLSREQSFAELLIRREFVLRTDLLRPWAHWVTPEFERRRYDTRFFAARLPEGQTPDDRTTEAAAADWVRPRTLLAEFEAGRAQLLPPTVVCLEQVAAARDAREFLGSAPPMLRVMPVLESDDAGRSRLRVELPAHRGGPSPSGDHP